MEHEKFLYLTRSDVAACNVSLDESLRISEETYAELAKGNCEMPPKPGVHPNTCPGAFLHAMPAYHKSKGIVGIKWVGVFGHNPMKYQIPSSSALLVLNDIETGYPIAVMEAGLITAIRTANASGVSAKFLAKKNAKVLGIVGAGEQGRGTIISVCRTTPSIEEVRIYDLFPAAVERCLKEVAPQISAKIVVCSSAEEVIRGADIIATSAPLTEKKPVYHTEWLKEGALVLPVHCNGWPLKLLKENAKFVVDDWNQYHNYMFGPGKYYEEDMEAPHALLGEVILGTKAGRENDQEIIVNSNLGIALQDIALADEILRIAKEKNLGQMLSLF